MFSIRNCKYNVGRRNIEKDIRKLFLSFHKFCILVAAFEIKVPLRSKFCIPFFLQLLKVEVINTYHAKFYIEIPTGRPVILNAKFSFAVPPLLERQMAVNHIESWI